MYLLDVIGNANANASANTNVKVDVNVSVNVKYVCYTTSSDQKYHTPLSKAPRPGKKVPNRYK